MLPNLSSSEFNMGLARGLVAGMPNGHELTKDLAHLAKAVTSGNPNALDSKTSLVGTEAIRPESLEATLRSVVERDEQFNLIKRLNRPAAKSILLEHATVEDIGGFIGGTFNSELGVVREAQTDYSRTLLRLAIMSTRVVISYQAASESHITEIEAQEYVSATTRIARDQEVFAYRGDSRVNPFEFDGITATLEKYYQNQIVDLNGTSDTQTLFETIQQEFGDVKDEEGGYGSLSDIYLSHSVQTELDTYLAPQWRVPVLGGENPSIQYGSPVYSIKTSFGNLALNPSVWITDYNKQSLAVPPAGRRRRPKPLYGPAAPDLPTIAVLPIAPPAGETSYFDTAKEGTYYYTVAGINGDGEGAPSVMATAALVAGQCVQITITPGASANQTGWAIYRSTQDPAAAPELADMRLVKRIASTDSVAATVYVDCNTDLPGTSPIYLGDFKNSQAIDFPELSPIGKFELYPTNQLAKIWAVSNFAALRLGYPKRFRVLKNYVTKNAAWKPHTAP